MARIRELAKQGAYSWELHVFGRSDQRDIDIHDAIEVLRLGGIDGPISAGINPGEWKCKVVAKIDKSARDVGVAVVVIRDEELFLITVQWEDTK